MLDHVLLAACVTDLHSVGMDWVLGNRMKVQGSLFVERTRAWYTEEFVAPKQYENATQLGRIAVMQSGCSSAGHFILTTLMFKHACEEQVSRHPIRYVDRGKDRTRVLTIKDTRILSSTLPFPSEVYRQCVLALTT